MTANPNNLQVAALAAPTECNELNFQGLYLYHTSLGSNANQARIIDSKGPMGTANVNNWTVYDGTGSDAKVVARAQGFHIKVGNWLNSFNLVFENERFSGSTLQAMGITVESGEWTIVGGTGQFAMATGVISKRFHQQKSDGNIIELTICCFCPVLKERRYLVTKLGTWGGNGGDPMDITEAQPSRLKSITVYTSSVVNSIEFSYFDYIGEQYNEGPWGGSGGEPKKIKLSESELITEVSGTIDSLGGNTVISSIKFVISLHTYGPWGEEKGTPFTVPVQPGSNIVAFFDRSGDYLNAIGVYLRPL